MKNAKTCFGLDSVYGMLFSQGGKIILFGNEKKGFTFAHFIEESIGVSYRFFKDFNGYIIDENGLKTSKNIKYYVRYLDRRSILSIDKNIDLLKKSNNFNIAKIGGGKVVLIDAKKYYNSVLQELKRDENSFLID